jgi:SAM-dependent methyltransferase
MLNWAARYFPILRALKPQLAEAGTLLEIGSGAVGIGMFRPYRFVGCEIKFVFPPQRPMMPVVASATGLPFADQSFDAVVCSDVLEHVPPDFRNSVIQESLRVAGKVAIFGFPSGGAASEYDARLARFYERKGQDCPAWLREHFQYQPLPTAKLFEQLPPGWSVSCIDNENVAFHNWVMETEMYRLFIHAYRILLKLVPGLMETLLRRADRAPYYRKIFVVQRAN